jgi:NADPH:quinone reductase-like Zn-dependent oxidoreductase
MKAMAQRSWAQGERMEMTEMKTPEPARDEVRVAVKAAGVNPVDWKLRSMGPLRVAARLLSPPPPVVVGIDFAGIVDAVGPDVTSVKPGDAVVGGTVFARRQRGSYADTVVVREDQLTKLPEGFDLVVAGALPVAGVTAWMSLFEVGPLPKDASGQRVLILGGSGGVGHLAVQFAKMHGATVAAVCSTRNVDFVRGLGADVVIDYTRGDPLDEAAKHGPFRVVVDTIGSYSGARCRSLLDKGGLHVIVSGDTVLAAAQVLVPPFTSKSVLGRPTGARLKSVVDAVASGRVKVHLAERIPLAEAERAHELGRGGRVVGKLVLVC